MAKKTLQPFSEADATDSAALHDSIQTLIHQYGRGGLSYYANLLGITPSMLQKRLKVPGRAFDPCTLRAAVLVMEINAGQRELPEPSANTPARPAPNQAE